MSTHAASRPAFAVLVLFGDFSAQRSVAKALERSAGSVQVQNSAWAARRETRGVVGGPLPSQEEHTQQKTPCYSDLQWFAYSGWCKMSYSVHMFSHPTGRPPFSFGVCMLFSVFQRRLCHFFADTIVLK